jgi:hypothetical protein
MNAGTERSLAAIESMSEWLPLVWLEDWDRRDIERADALLERIRSFPVEAEEVE